MKLFICVVFLSACVATGWASKEDKWKEFKAKHNKTYPHEQRETVRRKLFEDLDDKIEEHNKKALEGKIDYTIGHNQFSDLGPIEKATVKGYVKSKNSTKEVSKELELPLPVARFLPAAVDLRTRVCMPPMADQGRCGSCWAFAATTMTQFYNCVKSAKVFNLSQQHLVSCDFFDSGCNGGAYETAWIWLMYNGGQCSASSSPYTSGITEVDGACRTCTKTATVTGYRSIAAGDVTAIMSVLATGFPVAVAIHANENFMQYTSGVYNDPTCTNELNHAITVVGYGTLSSGIPYWIVRNSWGTGWGQNGYGLMRRGVNMCGIEDAVAYPTV